MSHHVQESPRQRAKEEAERLFRALRRNHRKEEPVRVIYPKRFHPGHFIIGVLIPIDDEPMRLSGLLSRAHAGYHYPPAIINSGGERRLRLIWRFPRVNPGDDGQLYRLASAIAAWAEDLLGRRAIIFPDSGIVATRAKLRIE